MCICGTLNLNFNIPLVFAFSYKRQLALASRVQRFVFFFSFVALRFGSWLALCYSVWLSIPWVNIRMGSYRDVTNYLSNARFIYGKPDVPKASRDVASQVYAELENYQFNGDWDAAVKMVVESGDPNASSFPTNNWYRLRRSLEIIKVYFLSLLS